MHEMFQLWQVNIRFSLERVREGVHWSRSFMMVNTVKYFVTYHYPLPPKKPKPKQVRKSHSDSIPQLPQINSLLLSSLKIVNC